MQHAPIHPACHNNRHPLSILYIYLDFSTWDSARSWSYSAQLALEEGFVANGIEFLSIPAIRGLPSRLPGSWLSRARELCAGRRFDQVWVELVHSPLDEEFLDWLASLAPVRIGILPESLDSDPAMCAMIEKLENRRTVAVTRMRYMTHVLAVDEADAARLNSQGGVKALWWPQAIPARYIVEELPSATSAGAIFPGAAYPWRKRWLEDPRFIAVCRHQSCAERHTQLPGLFDAANRHALSRLNQGGGCTAEHLEAYGEVIRYTRRESFRLWLRSLQEGCAVVNLPSVVRGHAGRVVEAMAAGRPVVSWQIPDRPATNALFEEGRDMLTFPAEDVDELIKQVSRLQHDPAFAANVARNARRKILRHHTTEHRVAQILDWIYHDRIPDYTDRPDSDAHAAVTAFCREFRIPPEIVIGSPPSSPAPQADVLKAAGEALAARNPASAAQILESAVVEYPDFSEMLGSLHLLLGNLDKAENYSLVAVTRSPNDVTPLITAAKVSLARNNFPAALAFCGQAYTLNVTAEQSAEIATIVDRIPRGSA